MSITLSPQDAFVNLTVFSQQAARLAPLLLNPNVELKDKENLKTLWGKITVALPQSLSSLTQKLGESYFSMDAVEKTFVNPISVAVTLRNLAKAFLASDGE